MVFSAIWLTLGSSPSLPRTLQANPRFSIQRLFWRQNLSSIRFPLLLVVRSSSLWLAWSTLPSPLAQYLAWWPLQSKGKRVDDRRYGSAVSLAPMAHPYGRAPRLLRSLSRLHIHPLVYSFACSAAAFFQRTNRMKPKPWLCVLLNCVE